MIAIPNDKYARLNLTKYPFKKWIRFVFDHPVAPQHQLKWWNSKKPFKEWPQRKEWYSLDKWEYSCNPNKLVKNATKLFNNLSVLGKYTDDQINQGCYYLAFGTYPHLPDLINNPKIPFKIRENCIKSMANLYKEVFSKRNIPDASSMWWDWFRNFSKVTPWSKRWIAKLNISPIGKKNLLKNILGLGISKKQKVDAQKISNVKLKVLREILRMDSVVCQKGALHGLGHLRNPRVKEVIKEYLQNNPNVKNSIKKYALACMAGEVL